MFVLKGGLLLAVFDARRSTADADLLARHLANDHDTITNRVKAIRDDADYTGVRVAMNCHVSTASVKLRLDINVGNPVTPAPQLIELPSQRPTSGSRPASHRQTSAAGVSLSNRAESPDLRRHDRQEDRSWLPHSGATTAA